jgi:hypothetical protein
MTSPTVRFQNRLEAVSVDRSLDCDLAPRRQPGARIVGQRHDRPPTDLADLCVEADRRRARGPLCGCSLSHVLVPGTPIRSPVGAERAPSVREPATSDLVVEACHIAVPAAPRARKAARFALAKPLDTNHRHEPSFAPRRFATARRAQRDEPGCERPGQVNRNRYSPSGVGARAGAAPWLLILMPAAFRAAEPERTVRWGFSGELIEVLQELVRGKLDLCAATPRLGSGRRSAPSGARGGSRRRRRHSRAFVSSVAPSVRPRCQAAYSPGVRLEERICSRAAAAHPASASEKHVPACVDQPLCVPDRVVVQRVGGHAAFSPNRMSTALAVLLAKTARRIERHAPWGWPTGPWRSTRSSHRSSEPPR